MADSNSFAEFLADQDLDIRNTKALKESSGISPRFMDQKVTPDVLTLIAACVAHLDGTNGRISVQDIWDLDLFKDEIDEIYNKPNADEKTAKSEYNKFIGQPLKTMTFAGVLSENRNGRAFEYKVTNPSAIEFIASGERPAFRFLVEYLNEVLIQSELDPAFRKFFDGKQTPESFAELKSSFDRFILRNTPINTKTEVHRIFPKVLNPLAVNRGTKGTVHGRLSPARMTYTGLLYNRVNWRDKKKVKDETRAQKASMQETAESRKVRETQKAMKLVRDRHKSESELKDLWATGKATQVHHIFPRSTAPNLAASRENLILLTATQHNAQAHPNNDTHRVDPDYQIECLIAKTDSIERSIDEGDGFYSVEGLILVLNTGYGAKLPDHMTLDQVRQYLFNRRNAVS